MKTTNHNFLISRTTLALFVAPYFLSKLTMSFNFHDGKVSEKVVPTSVDM